MKRQCQRITCLDYPPNQILLGIKGNAAVDIICVDDLKALMAPGVRVEQYMWMKQGCNLPHDVEYLLICLLQTAE